MVSKRLLYCEYSIVFSATRSLKEIKNCPCNVNVVNIDILNVVTANFVVGFSYGVARRYRSALGNLADLPHASPRFTLASNRGEPSPHLISRPLPKTTSYVFPKFALWE